jgi:hypothetical protein
MKTLMQLIKLVLDEAYGQIALPDEQAKDALITKEIDCLSEAYRRLKDPKRMSIDYSDPLKRFAYIYKYTVAHADYIRQLIRGCSAINAFFTDPRIEVACLGGGPGSDLLGIMKYMLQIGSKTKLKCYIFDKERAWGDSWSDVADTLESPFQVFPIFEQLDVADSRTWSSYHKYLRADLFTLSFFVSEVWCIRTKAEPFFEHCFTQAKTGALFLFIDNNAPPFYGWFDTLASRCGLQVIQSKQCPLAFSIDEEKTDLGIYYQKFGWPRRESDVAFRIMRKS